MDEVNCSVCNRLVPSHNLAIHEARCSKGKIPKTDDAVNESYSEDPPAQLISPPPGSSATSGTATAGISSRTSSSIIDISSDGESEFNTFTSSTWNTNSTSNAVSGVPAFADLSVSPPHKRLAKKSVTRSRSKLPLQRSGNMSSSSTSRPAAAAPVAVREGWECPRCTFYNDLGSGRCAVCSDQEQHDELVAAELAATFAQTAASDSDAGAVGSAVDSPSGVRRGDSVFTDTLLPVVGGMGIAHANAHTNAQYDPWGRPLPIRTRSRASADRFNNSDGWMDVEDTDWRAERRAHARAEAEAQAFEGHGGGGAVLQGAALGGLFGLGNAVFGADNERRPLTFGGMASDMMLGAAVGAAGGMVVDALGTSGGGAVDSTSNSSANGRSQNRARGGRGGGGGRAGGRIRSGFHFGANGVLAGRDIDMMSYDELLTVFGTGNTAKPTCRGTIHSLPTQVVAEPDLPVVGESSVRESDKCAVCLEVYGVGDRVKTLPCLHRYHETCIDRWLKSCGTCPVCKHEIA